MPLLILLAMVPNGFKTDFDSVPPCHADCWIRAKPAVLHDPMRKPITDQKKLPCIGRFEGIGLP